MNEFKKDLNNEIEKINLSGYPGYSKDLKAMFDIFSLADVIRAKYEYELLRGSDATEYLIFLQIATNIYLKNKN
jgi:hypothetical protein